MHKQSKNGGPIANMSAIKTAIANNEVNMLTELLDGESLDKLQKDYLMDLAQMSSPEIQDILAKASVKTKSPD